MNLIEFLSYFEEISRKFPEKSLDEILEIFKTKAEVKLPEAFKRGEKWLRRLEEKKINNQIRKAEEIGKSDIQVMNSDEELVKLNLQETSITDRIKRGDIINDAEELKVVKLRIEELEKRLS